MKEKRKFDDFSSFARDYRKIGTESVISVSGVDSDYFSEYKLCELAKYEKNGGLTVLDFGCGDGNSAQYFFKHLRIKHYYGVDIDAESIAVAQERNLQNCTFSTFDGENLPFPDESFDLVFIACVFHHVDSSFHVKLLRQCNRVLKRGDGGGRLYIFEHNPLNPVTRKIVRDCPFDKDAVLISSRKMGTLLKCASFSETKRKYTIFFPRKNLFKLLLPLEQHLSWCPLGGQYYWICKKSDYI